MLKPAATFFRCDFEMTRPLAVSAFSRRKIRGRVMRLRKKVLYYISKP
jgi:hypothetical protein